MVAEVRDIQPRRRKLLGWAGVLLLAAAPGLAQPGLNMPGLITDLGSPDIMKREEAMRVLSTDASLSLAQLEEMLGSPDLSPEQRCRILQAAKQRFLESPRPAMGVQFDSVLMDRVAIETVYPNFPSAKVLQPGDIIVACEGEKLHSRSAWLRLGAHIFSREPGETISVEVRRGEEKLRLDIELGRYSELSARGGPGLDRLERAWELRSQRHTTGLRAPIDPQIPAEDWKPEQSFYDAAKYARFKAQMPKTYRPSIVAGGEPRGGELTFDELMVAQQNPGVNAIRNRAWAQQQLAQQGIGMGWGELDAVGQTTAQEISALENRRLALERQLEQLGAPGAARPDQLVQLERGLQRYREELDRVKKLLAAIRAEAADEQAAKLDSPALPQGGER